jgi:hypothetical protein
MTNYERQQFRQINRFFHLAAGWRWDKAEFRGAGRMTVLRDYHCKVAARASRRRYMVPVKFLHISRRKIPHARFPRPDQPSHPDPLH